MDGGFLFNKNIPEANDQINTHDNLERDDFDNFVTTSYDPDTVNNAKEDGDE